MRIDVAQRTPGAQVPFAIAKQMRAAVGQWQRMADGGQGVLHDAVAPLRHVHITAGQRAHAQLLGQRLQGLQACGIVLLTMQFHRQECALCKHALQPRALLGLRLITRQPQCKDARDHIAKVRFHLGTPQPVRALACRTPAGGDHTAQLRIAVRVLHQQHEARAIDQGELAADNQLHAGGARSFQPTHDAGQRAFVGDGQRAVAAVVRTRKQLLGTGGPTQERKIRQAVQLGIRRQRVGHCGMGDVVVGRTQPRGNRPAARHAPAGRVAIHAIDGIVPTHGWLHVAPRCHHTGRHGGRRSPGSIDGAVAWPRSRCGRCSGCACAGALLGAAGRWNKRLRRSGRRWLRGDSAGWRDARESACSAFPPADASTHTPSGRRPSHANHPCSIQPSVRPGDANTQARRPREVSTT